MNIIFLTISLFRDVNSRGIYTDLIRYFSKQGHNVSVVSPIERKYGYPTELKEIDGVKILNIKTLNLQKTNIIEKGIGTILLETQFKYAIKKYIKSMKFDLILYSTPPITFTNVIKYLKKSNPTAISYLLLKDIFPQNAVDLGMFSKSGFVYRHFRKKEIELYKISDYIGCMSPSNVDFIIRNNNYLDSQKVEIAPNSIELIEQNLSINKSEIRKKYNLPSDKLIFIYGGNLGKPQGIEYLKQCLEENKDRTDCHFLIVGNGTEFSNLQRWYHSINPKSVSLYDKLPKEDYDVLVQSCDVGLIFLDFRFLIPNYPSRLLSYLEYKMPIIAATDVNSDIGKIAEENDYGFCCKSEKTEDFTSCVNRYIENPEIIKIMGENGYEFMKNNYLVSHTYNSIMKHF